LLLSGIFFTHPQIFKPILVSFNLHLAANIFQYRESLSVTFGVNQKINSTWPCFEIDYYSPSVNNIQIYEDVSIFKSCKNKPQKAV
jgi:hypothetical protein